MKKRSVILASLFIILLVLPIFVCASNEKISNLAIENAFNDGKENVSVLISAAPQTNGKFKSNSVIKDKNFISKDINYTEYLDLMADKDVQIEYNFKIKTLLQQSTPLINAPTSWTLQTSGINLTGNSQSVCILDTGINYSHSDFGSCSSVGSGGSCRIIGGYDFGNNDNDPLDYDGHGTHVAGIAAANGGINGVAPTANIVAVKVFSDAGFGSEQDIINGINWCVNNASEFNITTISMSLGLVDEFDNSILYDNYCDDEGFNLLRNAINSAVAQNISVVIASGNDGYANAIGVPACMQNAIPVSSTNKADTNISGFANTWNNSLLRILAAPGENINSTRWDPTGDNAYCSESGNYMVCSGTSMATPHVAGAITIINQYLFSIDRRKTPLEIEDLLNSTGKQIFDPSADRYFSRIDIYSALMEIDATNPGVTLSSPVNNLVDYNSNQTFSCNTSDWQLNNITLYLWNSTGLNYTETKNVSGITNVTNFSLIDLTSGNYVWNCKSSDVKGNTAFATNNFSIVIGGVSISLNYPLNNTYTRQKETTFNCSAITGQDRTIKNMTFFIYENETLANYSNVTLSGNQNSSFFNVTFFNETKYTWGCESYSNESDYMAENFTIYYDISYPAINTISEAVTTNQVTITFNTNEYTNYSILLNSIYSNSSTFSENQNLVRTGLTPYTTYQYSLTYCDRAGNCNVSVRSFTTSTSSGGGGGGSGWGGGGGGSTPIKLTEEQLANGYSKKYFIGDKISFVSNSENHSIQLNKIVNGSVNITIRSDPINLIIQTNEEKNLNLTSLEYYDLYVKVENVTVNSANITIKKIEELINPHQAIIENNPTKTNNTDKEKEYTILDKPKKLTEKNLFPAYALIILLIIIFFYFLLRKSTKKNAKEETSRKNSSRRKKN